MVRGLALRVGSIGDARITPLKFEISDWLVCKLD